MWYNTIESEIDIRKNKLIMNIRCPVEVLKTPQKVTSEEWLPQKRVAMWHVCHRGSGLGEGGDKGSWEISPPPYGWQKCQPPSHGKSKKDNNCLLIIDDAPWKGDHFLLHRIKWVLYYEADLEKGGEERFGEDTLCVNTQQYMILGGGINHNNNKWRLISFSWTESGGKRSEVRYAEWKGSFFWGGWLGGGHLHCQALSFSAIWSI